MKKQIRAVIIATIITCAIIISCAYAMPVQAEAANEAAELGHGEFYPKLAMVISSVRIDTDLWIVNCQDRTGNVWAFFDDEGTWEIGDIANLLMWNLGEREEDNEIIEVYWEGYTDNLETFFKIIEWR